MNEKTVTKIGWFASIMATAMYISYIDQIILNVNGQPGSTILPVITMINCTAWTLYGALKAKRDYPIIICNIPGIILGAATAIKKLN